MKIGGLRGLIAFFSAVVIVLSLGVPANAAGTAPNLLPVQGGEAMVFLAEEDADTEWGSNLSLQPRAPDANLQRDPWIRCPAIDDPICDFKKLGYDPLAFLTMPTCESATAEDCIEGVSFFKSTESLPVEYFANVPGQTVLGADEKTKLYRGGVAPIFKVPGAPHAGGDLYMVSGKATANYQTREERFVTNDFNLFVIPVSIQDSSYASRFSSSFPCLWQNADSCGIRHDFPENIRVGVQIRATKDIGGWFLGRMQSPDVLVESFSPRNNRISVVAAPVEVARFAYTAPKSQFSLEDRRAAGNFGIMGMPFEASQASRIYNTGYDTSNFGLLNHFRDRVKDTSVGTTSHWALRTTSKDGGNPCLSDKSRVLGIVSTNAMVYDGFAPRFNSGFLDYRVAGLHLLPDGQTPVVGTYDLVMRSETARCLYGFTNAPVSATLTITGTGNLNIATTVVSERNGWLKLAAYGFTFSEKEIKVNITQQAAPNPLTLNLARFTGISTRLSMSQRFAIEDFVFASTGTTTVNCTALFVKATDKSRALTRARAACNYAKSLGSATTVTTKQTKTKSLDGRVVLQSR